MIESNQLQSELERFGLTKNQAKIYLALVTHKELRIQDIVTTTKINRSSVRESLHGLFELGIIEEVIEQNFKKIRPYPIGAIKNGLEDRMSYLEKLKADIKNLEAAIDYQKPDTS